MMVLRERRSREVIQRRKWSSDADCDFRHRYCAGKRCLASSDDGREEVAASYVLHSDLDHLANRRMESDDRLQCHPTGVPPAQVVCFDELPQEVDQAVNLGAALPKQIRGALDTRHSECHPAPDGDSAQLRPEGSPIHASDGSGGSTKCRQEPPGNGTSRARGNTRRWRPRTLGGAPRPPCQ